MNLKTNGSAKIVLVIEGGVLRSAHSNVEIEVIIHDIDDLFDTHSKKQQREIFESVSTDCANCHTTDSITAFTQIA